MKRPMAVQTIAVAALFACATGGSPKTEVTTAPGTNVAAYASFGWMASAEGAPATTAPESILDANLRQAIREQLVRKGYREVEQAPDLWIGFETSTVAREKTKGSPFRIGVGMGSSGASIGGVGTSVGVGTSMDVGSQSVSTEQEMKLSIRAVERRGNREVWVGTTTGLVPLATDAQATDKAVAATLADFPAHGR